MLFKMAWRNLWRNKRRTLITMASVFFAVILAVIMRSANTGIYEKMVHNVVSFSSGYIQVHAKGYWNEQSVDNSFQEDGRLNAFLSAQAGISFFVPRLESFALASNQEKTKGVMVLGILPETEDSITKLKDKLIRGKYLTGDDRGVMISEGLAASLKLDYLDTLVLLSQGYHGSSAAGKYPVTGIVRYPSPELDKRMVNMPLKLMQEMYGAENRITSVSVMLDESADMGSVKAGMMSALDTSIYEIMDWKQMMPELDQLIEGDLAGDYIVIGVLYLVIAFGVFGTVLMMARERMHEFGILMAIGMKKHILALVLMLESFMISFTAAFMGMLGAVPVVIWFREHPIRFGAELKKIYDRYGMEPALFFSDDMKIFTEQTMIVFTISVMLSFYTGWKILTLKVMDAIRS